MSVYFSGDSNPHMAWGPFIEDVMIRNFGLGTFGKLWEILEFVLRERVLARGIQHLSFFV